MSNIRAFISERSSVEILKASRTRFHVKEESSKSFFIEMLSKYNIFAILLMLSVFVDGIEFKYIFKILLNRFLFSPVYFHC